MSAKIAGKIRLSVHESEYMNSCKLPLTFGTEYKHTEDYLKRQTI